jgi:hypothetical protein
MIQATGEGGELVRSGRTIATLGSWDMHSDKEGLVIKATAKDYDAYLLPRTKCAHVRLTIGKATVRYAVYVTWDNNQRDLTLTRGGDCA